MRIKTDARPLPPVRTLHVVGTLSRGGIETWLRQSIPHLPRHQYRIDFCTYRRDRGAYAAELERCGCQLHHIPLGSTCRALFRFVQRFRKLLSNGRYDVVHCHGLLLIGFILLLAWMEHVPVRIAHGHSADRKTGRPFSAANCIGLALNRVLTRICSTHGIGCSAEAGDALFGKNWQRNANYKILHCGIDLTPFGVDHNPHSIRTELGIQPGAAVVGHVGNFSVAKNHDFLVEIAARTFQQRADAVLLLVGDGNLRRAIEKKCAALGIRGRVIFAGVSSRVPELMQAMDVFVMPSFHEGLPLVLLEAQAAGLPCLVSDAVSREAMVSEGAIEFLPLASGVELWADAVLSMLKSGVRRPDLLPRMAESDYNVVTSAKHIEEFYGAAQMRLS